MKSEAHAAASAGFCCCWVGVAGSEWCKADKLNGAEAVNCGAGAGLEEKNRAASWSGPRAGA